MRKRKIIYSFLSCLFCCGISISLDLSGIGNNFTLSGLSLNESALGESSSKPVDESNDFGAETTDPDTIFDEMVKPLPTEMVEDTNKPAPEVRDSGNKHARKKDKQDHQNKHDDGGSEESEGFFPKTQGELTSLLDEDSAKKSDSSSSTSNTSASTFLNVKDAEIATLVKTFSKITKRNFIVDSDVKGKITIHLPSAVTEEEALRIFDSVLLIKGFTTVPVGENTWKVVSAKDAKSTTIPLVSESGPKATDTLVTQLLRMKYVPAEEMQKVLSQFISKDGIINAFTGTNSLIIIDSAANINRLLKIVKELDVAAVDQDITIISIKYAEAGDISEKILKILQDDSDKSQGGASSAGQQPRTVPTPGPMGGNAPSRNPGQSAGAGASVGVRTLPLKIIPDERTNSVIVVADQEMTARVEALAKQLDSPLDLSGGRFHVYKLKHSKSEEIAQILNALVSGGASSYTPQTKTKGSSMSRSRSSKPGQNQFGQSGSNSNFNNYTPPAPTPTPSSSFASGGGSGGQQKGTGKGLGAQQGRVTFEGEVSIAPDTSTNSLIINASRGDFQKLSEVLEVIDARRRQVIVEATILEVSLAKQEGMGIELQGTMGSDKGGLIGQTNFGGLTNVLTNPAALSDLTIAAASSGTLTLPGGFKIPTQAFLVSALSKLSNVNVLSAPTILTTDNEEAEIIVGENVPFVTGTSQNSSNLNNTFNQVERQDVGITLRITPQISTSDFVTLNIFVEISNVVPATRNDPNGPTTTIRTTETVVEVKSRQMIVTGGLISDSVTEATRGVPFLQDIPVLGEYFQRKDNDSQRTNLLIFITPRIIVDQYEARDSTIEAKDSLEKAIDNSALGPDRKEVLNRQNIDNVFETSVNQDIKKPTTITPPRPASSSGDTASEGTIGGEEISLRPSGEDVADLPKTENQTSKKPLVKRGVRTERSSKSTTQKKDDGALELSVSPRLPGELPDRALAESGESRSAKSRASSTNNEKPSYSAASNHLSESPSGVVSLDGDTSLASPPSQSETNTYTILRSIDGDTPKTIGIATVGSVDSLSGTFFQVGGRYTHRSEGNEAKFVCIGKYSSMASAAQQFPELAKKDSWHYLSALESLRLGSEKNDGEWTAN